MSDTPNTSEFESYDLLDGVLSVKGRRWLLRAPDAESVRVLGQQAGVSPTVARLMAGRGVGVDEAAVFLDPKLRDVMPDPSTLQDMDKAAGAILDAMQAGQNVTVFADYDVDGGTSAAQILRWARHYQAKFGLYVPDRILEGYGPSREAFETLKEQGQDLVITVDCGAAAKLALEAASDIGLDVVVIDHHLMGADLPAPKALVNPNRADDTSGLGILAAAGVTFLLLVALNREAKARGLGEGPKLLDLLGLAALGTVCDVVPLRGLNRAIVAQGLKVLSQRKQAGVQALSDVARAGDQLSVYDLGFLLGPRINAGGRIGEADMGAKLLSDDNLQTAYGYAAELDRVNIERRAMQDSIQREAMEQAGRLDHPGLPALVLTDPDWHPGIIGIVAGRLKDRLSKPVILIGGAADGSGKGSGRSLKGVNLGAAIVAAKEAGLLTSGGGHAMAGGLGMDMTHLDEFREFLSDAVRDEYEVARKLVSSKVDLILSPDGVDLALLNECDRVGPYGAEMPKPVVALSDVRLTYADRLKGGHVRVSFEDAHGAVLRGICFRADESGLDQMLFEANPGPMHVLGTVKRDRYGGREKADFHVLDLARATGPLSYDRK